MTSLYSKYCFIWNFFRSLPKRMHFKPLYSHEELDPLGAKWWVEATLLRMQCRINTANELVSCSRRTSPKSTKPTTDDRLVTGTKRVPRAPSYFVRSEQKLSNSMVQCAWTVHLCRNCITGVPRDRIHMKIVFLKLCGVRKPKSGHKVLRSGQKTAGRLAP